MQLHHPSIHHRWERRKKKTFSSDIFIGSVLCYRYTFKFLFSFCYEVNIHRMSMSFFVAPQFCFYFSSFLSSITSPLSYTYLLWIVFSLFFLNFVQFQNRCILSVLGRTTKFFFSLSLTSFGCCVQVSDEFGFESVFFPLPTIFYSFLITSTPYNFQLTYV